MNAAGIAIPKVKIDRADSRNIAKYGLDNWSELRQYASMDTIRYQLKMLNRQCNLYNSFPGRRLCGGLFVVPFSPPSFFFSFLLIPY